MNKLIPHSRPTVGKDEIDAVAGVILSGQISQGASAEAFEKAVASYLGVNGGVAVSSGTAALHLALLSLGVGEGDEVIIPDYTCTASLNAIRYVGAAPKVVDIVPGEYNIDPQKIRKSLTVKTKAIILIHNFGLPADISGVKSIGLPVIEDIAHSLGADYDGRKVGSFGDLAVVSFYATKMITTGEGGMVLSHSSNLLEKVLDLRDYDKKTDCKVRYNYKISDIQAAIGLVQMKRLQGFIKKRGEIASFYHEALKSLPISLPVFPEGRGHIYYRYIVEVKKRLSGLINFVRDKGIDVNRPIYMPIHRYMGGGQQQSFRHSLSACRRALSIPIYPSLSAMERIHIAEAIEKFYR